MNYTKGIIVRKDTGISKHQNIARFVFLFSCFFVLVLPAIFLPGFHIAEAANSFFGDPADVCQFWKEIFDFAIKLAGALTVLVLVIAGLFYMLAGGSTFEVMKGEEKTNVDLITKAKEMMAGALFGMMLAMLAYVTFTVLNPYLLECHIEIPSVELAGSTCVGSPTYSSQAECESKGGDCSTSGTRCILGKKGCKGKGEEVADKSECCENQDSSGKACTTHADCGKEGLCKDNKCIPRDRGLVKEGDSCNENDDCKSGICNTGLAPNECAPEKGSASGKGCNEGLDCESGICNTNGSNTCAPMGGKACSKDDECEGKVCEDSVCVAGSAPGKGCEEDKDCASKICNTKDTNKCTIKGGNPGTSLFPTSNACARDKDCASKICNTGTAPDTCPPVGGAEKGTACNKDEACASKICNRALGTIDDGQCAPDGGSANGEDCKTKRDCKSGFCKPTSVGDDECADKPK